MRKLKDYLIIGSKGMAMGAADVVPGVSGGTIAFISGIYEELIGSIKSIDHIALKTLFQKGPLAFWKHINGNFLISVFAGIGISVLSLVKLIHYLLENHPIFIWSFFFGLIIASAYTIAQKVKQWNISTIISLVVGIVVAYYITIATPAETPTDWWFIVLSGSIAICAMILPGISGSFILLLLKKYQYITGAIKDFDITTILLFGIGAGVGLISFSHVLSYLFKKFHDQTIAILTGFMLGSLNVVWPWKTVLETRINSKGEVEPFRFESVLPQNFDGEPQLIGAIVLAAVGFVLIVLLEKFANQKTRS